MSCQEKGKREVLVREIDSIELRRFMNEVALPSLDQISFERLSTHAFSDELKSGDRRFSPLDGHTYFLIEHHSIAECLIGIKFESRIKSGQQMIIAGLSLGRIVPEVEGRDKKTHSSRMSGREYLEEFIAQVLQAEAIYLIVARLKEKGSLAAFKALGDICRNENRSYQVGFRGLTAYVSNSIALLRETCPF
ncbi:MAG: hypothetical protein EPO61_12690 [Nitrospirae bacterium]|nr:MAG: hypothetical protein EPO61_12690 [Nitrospirota bacterium]